MRADSVAVIAGAELAGDQDGRLASFERVGDVGGEEAGQGGAALDVPLDQEHAPVVVRRDVADCDAALDALADDDPLLAAGDAVAGPSSRCALTLVMTLSP